MREFLPKALKGNGVDMIRTFDSLPEFYSYVTDLVPSQHRNNDKDGWAGYSTWESAASSMKTGDMALVSTSDAFMTKIETGQFESKAFRNIDSVVGGVPNIGNYLAGNPMAMRRRVRQESEKAPLVVIADLASSGNIASRDVAKRGSAILALVRILSGQRPVSLWFCVASRPTSVAHTYGSVSHAVRMDSAPIDIARAAHMLCNVSVPRRLFYDAAYHAVGKTREHLQWPYNNVEAYRTRGHEYWARALDIEPENTLFVPPIFGNDDSIKNPVAWVNAMIKKYGQSPDE